MGVVERQERAMLVIIDQRRIDRPAAEHPGADEIPEGGAENVQIGQPGAVSLTATCLCERSYGYAQQLSSRALPLGQGGRAAVLVGVRSTR